MTAQRILITGGSGFIGRAIIARLVRQGRKVVVPTRRREDTRALWPLPGVEIVQADIHGEGVPDALLKGCDALIHLIGILHGRPGRVADPAQLGDAGDPYGPDFGAVHVALPKRLADAAVRQGVRRFLHMSALGAGAADKRALPSMYLRSKAAGEQQVRDTLGLDWTVFRPSVVFGPDDQFLNLFARLQAILPVMALARPQALLQPVYVGDVADAFVNALDEPRCISQCYDLAGPKVYSLKALVQLAGRLSGHPRAVLTLPDALGRLQALMLEKMPGPTLMSRDNFDSLALPNTSSTAPAPELGLHLHALEDIAPGYLGPIRDAFGVARARAGR